MNLSFGIDEKGRVYLDGRATGFKLMGQTDNGPVEVEVRLPETAAPQPMTDLMPAGPKITRRETQPISWETIKYAIKTGRANSVLSVGDEITETLKTGEEVVFVVAGIDVYEKNQVIFTLKDCLEDTNHMNQRNTNEGGWPMSDMRQHLNSTIFG